MQGFRPALEAAFEAALAHLGNLDKTPVAATADLETLRERLGKPLSDEELPAEQVLADLIADVQGGIIGFAGGRFFGWVVGGSLPAALAADWLTSAWDQNAVLYASGPAAAVVEEIAGDWLKDILGLPRQASFAFVSGCQMAHLTCLASARHALLERQGWDVEQQGLYGGPPIRILASDQRHGSIERALRLLGMGRAHITTLDRMQPDALENALHHQPTAIVVLQAGDINTGAFDDFATLVPIAKRHGAWVHIDGAFGLWTAASPRYKHLIQGVEQADSWATDGHKWLNVPFDCGYAFVAHPESHRAAMSHSASYLTFDAAARDATHWVPEWSRRARGFSTYAALRQLGRNGVARLVERCCAHARTLVTRIGELPGVELLSAPVINQGLVRFLDRPTDRVIAAIQASGEAFFTASDWKGQRVMRISVCNWQTSDDDVDRAVAAVAKAIASAENLSSSRCEPTTAS